MNKAAWIKAGSMGLAGFRSFGSSFGELGLRRTYAPGNACLLPVSIADSARILPVPALPLRNAQNMKICAPGRACGREQKG
jgi:hypothetical protein